MATDHVFIDEGTTTKLPTYSITEDADTKQLSRSVLNNQAGSEVGVAAIPLQVSLANTAANATAIKVDGSAVTQPISITTLPAGTNNIGDVDILTVPADPFGANADAASATGSISAKLRFIASTGIPITGTVTVNAHAVTNAGTFVVQENGAALTALQLLDDIVYSGDAVLSKYAVIGAVFDDVAPVIVTENNAQSLRMTSGRGLHVSVRDSTGDSAMDDTNNALRVNIVAGGAGDGAILDGVSASIKATVLDYTNSNPLAVRLTDTNGDFASAGGGTQYTEDVASAADPIGTQLIARRRDALSSETTTDGDNTAVNSTAKGELYVKHVDTIPVTQSGTWNITNVSGTVSLPTGASTAAKQPALGTAGSASTDVITVQGIASMTALKVDGSAVTQPVSMTTLPAGTNNIGDVDVLTLPALVAGTANIGDVDVLTVPADPFGVNADAASATGSISAKLRFIASTGIPITGTVTVGSHAVTNAGTFAVQAACAGDVAHDGADSGNPVKQGRKAIAHGTNPTAVAAADRTDLYANRAGIPFSIGGHPNIVTVEAAYTAAQTDTAIVTVAGGLKIVVTSILAVCDNANTVNTSFRIGFGAANTPTTTGVVLTHPGCPAGSGVNRGDGSGILGIGADGEDLRITSSVPTTGSLRVLVGYFTIES